MADKPPSESSMDVGETYTGFLRRNGDTGKGRISIQGGEITVGTVPPDLDKHDVDFEYLGDGEGELKSYETNPLESDPTNNHNDILDGHL